MHRKDCGQAISAKHLRKFASGTPFVHEMFHVKHFAELDIMTPFMSPAPNSRQGMALICATGSKFNGQWHNLYFTYI
jgi:hypothetical protein